MPYFQLNPRPLPATASPAKVFAFVRMANESGSDVGRLALLVSEQNEMAGAILVRAGFVKDDTTTLPGGFGLDGTWRFFFCGPGGPFVAQPWTVDTGDADSRRYGNNLTLKLPSSPNNVDRPSTILVRTADAVPGDFNGNATGLFHRLPLSRHDSGPDKRSLQFADADNTTDDPQVDFLLPVRALPERAGDGIPDVHFKLNLDSNPNSPIGVGVTDPGATLIIIDSANNNVTVDGYLDTRLLLDGGAIVPYLDTANHQQIAYEHDPTVTLALPAGLGGLAQCVLETNGVCFRFDKDRLGVRLLPDALGEGVELRVRVEFSLIMADGGGGLAFLLPMLKKATGASPTLSYTLRVPIPGDWTYDLPVVEWNETRTSWSIAHEWLDAAAAGAWPILPRPEASACALTGWDFPLKDLLGDLMGGGASALKVTLLPSAFNDIVPLKLDPTHHSLALTLGLHVEIGSEPLLLSIDIVLDLETFRLSLSSTKTQPANDLRFRLPSSPHGDDYQIIDLRIFALMLPNQVGSDKADHGGLNLDRREFLLQTPSDNGPPALLVFPGNLSAGGLDNRFVFQLAPPQLKEDRDKFPWPEGMLLRIGDGGLSVSAKIDTSQSPVIFPGNELVPPIKIKPLSERGGVKSEIVLLDNAIRRAVISAEMDVPGTDDLTAQVELGLRQKNRGKPPEVYATVSLHRPSGKPIAQLSAGYLQLTIDKDGVNNWQLVWDMDSGKWNLFLPTDGSLALAPKTSDAGGLDDLRNEDAIKFKQLDLMNLHSGVGTIEVPIAKPVEFSCLDGLFGVTFRHLSFAWGGSFILSCESAEFRFKQAGQFDIDIKTGAISLEFTGGRKLKMRLPHKLEVDARIGEATRIRGLIEWQDDDRVRLFGIGGTMEMTGLPQATCGVTIGSLTKLNGQKAPLISIYGEADYQMTLFAGVTARRFGVGAGINRRLVGIDDNPNAEELLAQIDTLSLDNWENVERNGCYVAIVGTVLLSANAGADDEINPYVASLLLCIDSDLNVMAAGKLWLYSSVGYVLKPDNFARPALVGAVVVSPKQQLITAAVESRQNAAVEGNDQLARILKNGHLRFSFLLSPALVDFYLQDLSYQDEFFGATMLFRGSMRFAIFQGTVLLRANYSLTGTFDANASESCGGLNGNAVLAVSIDYGGLISQRGLIAYGGIDLSVAAKARLWTKIEFSITVRFGRKKWTKSWSRTFTLASAKFELGLAGNVGFNTSGQIGFDGRLHVSVPICGYRLNISPSFRFNDGVISDARNQVAAFEQRIEAYRQQLLGGGQKSLTAHNAMEGFALAESVQNEQWLLYRSGKWCVLIPRDDNPWVTPSQDKSPTDPRVLFKDHVTSFELFDKTTGNLLLRVRMPWDKNILDGDLPSDVQTHREEIEGHMLETADALQMPSLRTYEVHQDPRLRSTSRAYWTNEDQALLPDTALPIRMRPVQEILTGDRLPASVDADYSELVEYLFWRNRATRYRQHDAGDVTSAALALKNRAALLQFWLQELQEAPDDPANIESSSLWLARSYRTKLDPNSTVEPKDLFRVGYIFDWPVGQDISNVAFKLYRDPNPTTAQEMDVADPTSLAQLQAKQALFAPAPIRQEFVVDKAGDQVAKGELGRVVVKLPVSFNDQFFTTGGFETFSHFQVWRQMPWEDKAQLLANFLRPTLNPVDDAGRNALVVGGYVLTDDFPVESRELDSALTGRNGVQYYLRPVQVGSDGVVDFAHAQKDFQKFLPLVPYVPPLDLFPKQLTMAMTFDSLVPNGPHAADEFGNFTLLTIVDDTSDDKTGDTSGGRSVSRSKPATILQKDGTARPLAPEDFELYVESAPISESGFFGGSDDAADVGAAAPAVMLDTLDETSQADRGRSPLGKILLKVSAMAITDRPGWFKIIDNNLPPDFGMLPRDFGMAYRFYVRPLVQRPDAPPIAVGLLRALDHSLTRELPTATTPASSYRSVSHFEWIPQPAITTALDATDPTKTLNRIAVEITRRGAEVKDDLTAIRNRAGLEWQAAGTAVGGVELLVRDVDDSGLSETILCEILKDSVFRTSQLDFRNPSRWVPTPLEASRRKLGTRATVLVADDTAADLALKVARQYLYSNPQDPLVANLDARAQTLLGHLDPAGTDPFPDWSVSWAALKNWFTASFDFQKTPLDINDATIGAIRNQARSLSRWFLLGLATPVATLDKLTPDVLQTTDNTLNSLFTELETTVPDVDKMPADTDDQQLAIRRVLVDADLARQMVGVIRRRQACANEIFSSDDNQLPDAGTSTKSWLPSGDRFEELRGQVSSATVDLQGPLDRCKRLLAWFPSDVAADPRKVPAGMVLRDAIDKFSGCALPQRILGDPVRLPKTIACLQRAGGLTKALNVLADRLAPHGEKLVRRPHHQVALGTNNAGERTAVAVKLSDMIPDEGRATSPANLILHYGNVLERLGFALDIAVLDSLTNALPQVDLLERIADAKLPSLFPETLNGGPILDDHRVFVLAGREPDSEYRGDFPDNTRDYVGYSFVKLCVVPERFYQLIVSRLVPFATDTTGQKSQREHNMTELTDNWFQFRNIDTGAGDAAVNILTCLGDAAAYVSEGIALLPLDQLQKVGLLRLVSQDRRWTSLPHVGRRSRIDWRAPDQNKHHIYALGRRVSRYEPLIRWARRMNRPTAWPTDLASAAGLTEGVEIRRLITRADQPDMPEALPVSIHPHPDRVQFSLIQPAAGARSLMNVISAVRTGYKGYSVVFQCRLRDHEKPERSWAKLLAAAQFVDTGTVEDPPAVLTSTPSAPFADIRLFRNERLITLTDMSYIFDYWLTARSHYDADILLALPPGDQVIQLGDTVAGKITTAGQQINYGFHIDVPQRIHPRGTLGTDTQLHWKLVDAAGKVVHLDDGREADGGFGKFLKPEDSGEVALVNAGDYKLQVTGTGAFVGDFGFVLASVPLGTARRVPSLIAARIPTVKRLADLGDGTAVYEATVFLSRTGDLLTPREWGTSPPMPPLKAALDDGHGGTTAPLSFPLDRLPEPSCAYKFVYIATDPSSPPVYVHLCELLLPWNDEYLEPAVGQPLRPLFRKVSHVEVADADQYPPILCGHSEHELGGDDLAPTYRVVLKFTHKPGDSAFPELNLNKFRFYVTRAGKLSPVLPVA